MIDIKDFDLQVYLLVRFNLDSPEEITQQALDSVTHLIITSGQDPVLDDIEQFPISCETTTFCTPNDILQFKNLRFLRISGQRRLIGTLVVPPSVEELHIIDCYPMNVQIGDMTFKTKQNEAFFWVKEEGLFINNKKK